ncbi:MAG TPA: peptidylprolyl isomerase [Bellilinea sp.]|nr:peptidylprolyl isomerase [Bellilinea sp.]
MAENLVPTEVKDDVVVSMEYTLTVDGEIVDSSEGDDPLVFLQGHQNIIPGLEKALYGLKVGDSKAVSVEPEEGYGIRDEEEVLEVERKEFPEEIPLEPGVELDLRDDNGETLSATILEIGDELIVLDLNHPLAGKVLNFEVKIVDLREATEEELEHGHVHLDDEFEYDELDEDFDDDFDELDDDDDDKKDNHK